MYSYYKLKCLDCEDIIKIEYDTRKNPKSEWIKCNCGKLQTQADTFSFSYDRNSKYEILEHDTKALEEDFFVMNNETYKKYLKVKGLAVELKFDVDEYINNNFNKLENIIMTYGENLEYRSCAFAEIKLNIDLKFYDGFDYDKVNENINKKLDNFYKFLLCMREDKDILKQYDKLYKGELCGDIDFDTNKEISKYDYQFEF